MADSRDIWAKLCTPHIWRKEVSKHFMLVVCGASKWWFTSKKLRNTSKKNGRQPNTLWTVKGRCDDIKTFWTVNSLCKQESCFSIFWLSKGILYTSISMYPGHSFLQKPCWEKGVVCSMAKMKSSLRVSHTLDFRFTVVTWFISKRCN